MEFVTVGDGREALVGFAQHGYGVAVLRVKRRADVDGPLFFPVGTVDPDLALVVTPGDLGNGAVAEAARLYLRESGEWGAPGDVQVTRWVQAQDPATEGLVFLGPASEIECVAECTG